MATPSPPPDLYIYHVNGPVPEASDLIGADFIGNWEEDGDTFLFFSAPSPAAVERLLERQPGLAVLDDYHMTYEDWIGGPVEPFQVGRIHVSPPWREAVAPAGDVGLLLDPGVVFGTGTHPTTRDCLIALEEAVDADPPATVLDLGTGTGLLALAAAAFGARHILAVDRNRLATTTAAANVRLNRMENRVLTVQADARDMVDIDAELAIANIHYDVLRHVITADGFRKKRSVILSGILRSQIGPVEDRLTRTGCRLRRRWVHDNTWFTLYGTFDL